VETRRGDAGWWESVSEMSGKKGRCKKRRGGATSLGEAAVSLKQSEGSARGGRSS